MEFVSEMKGLTLENQSMQFTVNRKKKKQIQYDHLIKCRKSIWQKSKSINVTNCQQTRNRMGLLQLICEKPIVNKLNGERLNTFSS